MSRFNLYFFLLLLILILASGCKERIYVTIYDPEAAAKSIPCMRLKIFPPDSSAQKELEALYHFVPGDCPYTLELSTKAGIHCNSGANVPQKVTSNFPSAYLRLELRRGMQLLYSYYIDLTHKPDASDIRKGFSRLCRDLNILKQE